MKKNDEHDAYCVATVLINQLHTLPDAKPEDNHWTLSQLVNRRDTLVKDGIRLKTVCMSRFLLFTQATENSFVKSTGNKHYTFGRPILHPLA